MFDSGDKNQSTGSPVDALGEALAEAERHRREGRLHEAEHAFRTALALRPDFPEAHNNLGCLYLQLGRLEEAERSFRSALQARPDFPEAHYNLAISLKRSGRLAEAAESFQHALAFRAEFPEAHNDLGIVYRLLERLGDAEACFRKALAARPDSAGAHFNLGLVHLIAGRLRDAEHEFRQALEHGPHFPGAQVNLGFVLAELGRLEEAEQSFRSALEFNRNDHSAAYNLALLRLLFGDYGSGLALYENRMEGGSAQFEAHRPMLERLRALPRWCGEPVQGKGLLIWSEQGLGDAIMLLRYLPQLKRRGASRIVLICPAELLALAKTVPDIDRVALHEAPPFEGLDFHCSMMSLPYLFQTRPDTIPREVPYLGVSAELIGKWRKRLAGVSGFRIGIAWQGSAGSRRGRSIPLARFSVLAQIQGVRLISLQKSADAEQLKEFRQQAALMDFSNDLDRDSGPFMDTAAIMKNLDLVVSSDSAVAHLAGALGVPVWLAIPSIPNWRWMLERRDSPWYPTMRLFRQKTPEDWAGVFEEIQEALRRSLS